ncbi:MULTISPECIES: thioredoxin domain-containing protein [unclassified Brenneria]|uniref:thioredoxin family protein n=1 Tax=unclassified Brenneria TaxID=2634434 RepID=UPI0029C2298D|nr:MULTISPECIES: thioredoxin domain-containing protein [unclassified Brenneria]MDX5630850.1 thioredoxin domain-containing protein [Brenneria sp. L3-3Z]MDX5697932.1 thioredoxin domain-containing protein [Brenneria sp. L4-2C]
MKINELKEINCEALLSGELPVLIDFWAPWCIPCRTLLPYIEKVAEDYHGVIKVVKVNVDEEPSLSRKFAIRALPTLIMKNNGNEILRLTGPSALRLRVMLERSLTEAGIHLPEAVDNKKGNSLTSLNDVVGNKAFSSFHNSHKLKAACLARFHEGTAKTEQGHIIPVTLRLTGNNSIEEQIGIPIRVGRLIDTLDIWLRSLTDDQDKTDSLIDELLTAIPLGKDLNIYLNRVIADALYNSEWRIKLNLDNKKDVELAAEVELLHRAELEGDSISNTTWSNYQRKAVLLNEGNTSQQSSMVLENIARPLAELDAQHVLTSSFHLAKIHYEHQIQWGKEDEKRFSELNSLYLKHKESSGIYIDNAVSEKEFQDDFYRPYRQEDGSFWEKFDKIQAFTSVSTGRLAEYWRKVFIAELSKH